MVAASTGAIRQVSIQAQGGIFFYALATLIGLSAFLGGGTAQGLASDLLIEIVSLPVLAMGVLRLGRAERLAPIGWPLALLAGCLLWPLLQLVPLPPALWSALPTRHFVVDTYQALGMPLPWRPLSLSPAGTRYSLFALLPAAAIFIGVLQIGPAERFRLLLAPMALAALSVLLSLAQRFGPNPAALSLFETPHLGNAIGFFANRNHFAALLYVMLPLSVAWLVGQVELERNRRPRWVLFGGCVIFILLAGLSVAFSRAGVTLGVVSAFLSVLLAARSLKVLPVGRLTVGAVALALLVFAILLQFGLIDLLEQRTAVDTYRETMAAVTREAIASFYVFGSGFGSFVPIYKMFEQVKDLNIFYANHAHNDWLELVLEGGLPAALLLAGFGIWLAVSTYRAWRGAADGRNDRDLLLGRAGSIAILLLLAHSTLDYPLRTTTLNCLFAFSCACLCPRIAGGEERRRRRRVPSGEALEPEADRT